MTGRGPLAARWQFDRAGYRARERELYGLGGELSGLYIFGDEAAGAAFRGDYLYGPADEERAVFSLLGLIESIEEPKGL